MYKISSRVNPRLLHSRRRDTVLSVSEAHTHRTRCVGSRWVVGGRNTRCVNLKGRVIGLTGCHRRHELLRRGCALCVAAVWGGGGEMARRCRIWIWIWAINRISYTYTERHYHTHTLHQLYSLIIYYLYIWDIYKAL